jgi:hypothetical protein
VGEAISVRWVGLVSAVGGQERRKGVEERCGVHYT